jgi:hypothetical protein
VRSGADYRNNQQLNAEYIVIKNTGNRAKQLKGWVVKDKANHRFIFPSYKIGPGGYVKIHTGKGNNRRGDLYWGSGNFVWNNDGDKAWVNTAGTTVDTCAYPGGGSTRYC